MVHSVSANGANIPAIGLGTWPLKGQECVGAVKFALENGYDHVDTAAMYDNEQEVGEGFRASGRQRNSIFLTTKVWQDNIGDGDLQRSAENSLRLLGLDDVDLLLIHWPNEDIPLAESIGALCDAGKRGLAKNVGVSNFPSAMLNEAVALADMPLATNQVEYHPFLNQDAVLAACRDHGMALTAYAPIAKAGELFQQPVIQDLARAKQRTEAQIVLRWHVQQEGVVAIPKSVNPERIKSNLAVTDFQLTGDEIARISALARPGGRVINPEIAPNWDDDKG